MAELKLLPTRAEIRELAQNIGARFRAQRVILFGSHAYGRPTRDSDADLLVIMETDRPNVEQAVEIRRQVPFPFAADLLVRTPEQLAQRLALGDTFLKEIMTRGIVLYEAAS